MHHGLSGAARDAGEFIRDQIPEELDWLFDRPGTGSNQNTPLPDPYGGELSPASATFEDRYLPGLTNGVILGETRRLPLADWVNEGLTEAVRALGPEYDVIVRSAGKPAATPFNQHERIGTTRHDNGNAVDFVLTRNGEPVLPGEDHELYERFFENAAPHFPGMGHYPWGVHVGGGDPGFWGPNGKASKDEAFVAARERGLRNASI